MIRYALACDVGHRFESWFGSGAAFDALAGRDLVACPSCGSTRVAKAIMAPAVRPSGPAKAPGASLPDRPPREGGAGKGLSDEPAREMRALVRAVRARVLAETQDVGSRFPDEARRMHEGDIPHRDIRGEATLDEARALLEDGIVVLPIPGAPGELN